jgi:hypothetical protein
MLPHACLLIGLLLADIPNLSFSAETSVPVKIAQQKTNFQKPYASNTPYALVTISYFAGLDPLYEKKIKSKFQSFLKMACTQSSYDNPCQLSESEYISKSDLWIEQYLSNNAYYVQEYYRTLSKKLPPNSIILQPQIITVDSEGQFTYQNQAMLPPSILTIDFLAYTTPYFYTSGQPGYLATFGNQLYVEPTVYTSKGFRKTIPLASHNNFYINSQTNSKCYGWLNLLNSLNHDDKIHRWTRIYSHGFTTKVPTTSNAFISYDKFTHFHSFKGSEELMRAQAKSKEGNIDQSVFSSQWDFYGSAVTSILNNMDIAALKIEKISEYAQTYDSALSGKLKTQPMQTLTDSEQAKVTLLSEFIKAEREFLTKQDQTFSDYLYKGDFGNSFRLQKLAEVDYLKKTHRMQAQNYLTGLAARTLAGYSVAMNGMSGVGLASSLLALKESGDRSTNQAIFNLSNVMTHHLSRTSDAQYEVVINTSKGSQTIKTNSIQDLRNQFFQLYATLFPPSMSTTQ